MQGRLKQFSFLGIESSEVKKSLSAAIAITLLFLLALGLARFDVQQSQYEINDVLAGYFNSMNRKEFSELGKYMYPTDNREHILTVAAKAKAVDLQSIRLQKIYPPLVDKNLAIVGIDTSAIIRPDGQNVTLKETNSMFLMREAGKWYIAKPEDLEKYEPSFISAMIDRYGSVLRSNLSEAGLQAYYNSMAFYKTKGHLRKQGE